MSAIVSSDPLRALIRRAMGSSPDSGTLARYRVRADSAGSGQVVLADVSGSMAEDAWGGRRKVEVLRGALEGAGPARLIAFASRPTPVSSPAALPEPGGSTALHLALDEAARVRPARTLVVSDGRPDSEWDALAAADRLPGAIDVIYVGPDGDHAAIDFMRRLASRGGGRYHGCDLRRSSAPLLGSAVRALLGSGR